MHPVVFLFLLVMSYFVIEFIIDIFKFKSFESKLHVGTHLQLTRYLIDDEFDPGHTFNITITQLGDKQVKVKYSDGSTETIDKVILYSDKWKIIDETKDENKNGNTNHINTHHS